MQTIHRSSSKFAWTNRCQQSFGTNAALVALIDRHLSLTEPVILKENVEQWNDRGMVGSGHDWATKRGKTKQHVEFELTDQPASVDFLGYLLALFFSTEAEPTAGKYTYVWKSINSQPEAMVTSFGLHESGTDSTVSDVACTKLKVSGQGEERLQVGGSFVGSKISPWSESWGTPLPNRYLYNYSGDFSFDGDSTKRANLKGFDLTLESGIKVDSAWRKASTYEDRIYPSVWPYTTERNFALNLSLIADSALISTFESNYTASAQSYLNLAVSCLGTGTDEFVLTVPKAVVTGLEESYDEEVLTLSVDIEGHYDESALSPLKIELTNSSSDTYMLPVTE